MPALSPSRAMRPVLVAASTAVIALLIACAGSPPTGQGQRNGPTREDENEADYSGLVLLKKTQDGTAEQFHVEITGIVENRTGENLEYVQITYDILDEQGNKVGTALGNVNGLKKGERWKFKAVALGEFHRFRYRLDSLSGH